MKITSEQGSLKCYKQNFFIVNYAKIILIQLSLMPQKSPKHKTLTSNQPTKTKKRFQSVQSPRKVKQGTINLQIQPEKQPKQLKKVKSAGNLQLKKDCFPKSNCLKQNISPPIKVKRSPKIVIQQNLSNPNKQKQAKEAAKHNKSSKNVKEGKNSTEGMKQQHFQLSFKNLLAQSSDIITKFYQEQFEGLNPSLRQKWKNDFFSFLTQKNTTASTKIQQKQPTIKAQYREEQEKSYSKHFYANILQDEQYQQQFLYHIATKFCGNIASTKLIYTWSPLHKSNIHEYIDNKPNLLFLIRTQEDSKIAAYTEMPFKRPYPEVGFGAIISLTNRKVFPVKKNQRAISYDGTYVAFGNYELLIKGNEINSNLGNAGGYYQSSGQKAKILFNEGAKNATKIAQLQVFQIWT